jgi:hypothetical protein
VILHRTRVVKVGGADMSFTAWVARKAGGKALLPTATPDVAKPVTARTRATAKSSTRPAPRRR